MSAAEEYLKELLSRREPYKGDALGELAGEFRKRERRPPKVFKDSSFLYMRSYAGDIGVRPFSGITFWRSPDIQISPVTNIAAYTTELEAGETYIVRCALRNRGDVAVPSAKVELFLTDPSLGFDTRYAQNLTLGKVPATWVAPGATASTVFQWTVSPSESGHKCLFARAFSFSPVDLPASVYALDPRTDRHVAQKNLNIAKQAQNFSFQIIHPPVARMRIELRALQRDELLRLCEPALAEVAPAAKWPERGWGSLAKIELEDRGEGKVSIELTPEGALLIAEGERQGGEKEPLPHRTRLRMTVPDLGLKPGEAVGLDITAVDESNEELGPVGGITLVIVG